MQTKQIAWEVVGNYISTLGEGPVWDCQNKCIFWLDIPECVICQYFPDSDELLSFKMESMVSSIAFRKSGGMISASKNGFSFVNLETSKSDFLINPEAHIISNRFNDGKCDPWGNFWAGTMSIIGAAGAGSLYRFNCDYSISVMLTNLSCSNGLAWNLDHSNLYFIDTPTREVVAFDYDINNGKLSNKVKIFTFSERDGLPDGMTIDVEGMLWVALWNGGKVVRINPISGKIVFEVSLPASRITSCAFGGNQLSDLYITSAKSGLTEEELVYQPLAGSLFVIKNLGVKGIESFQYKG